MTEYTVKIGFWLRAYDSFTVEAESDEDAVEKAKAAARRAIERSGVPIQCRLTSRTAGRASSPTLIRLRQASAVQSRRASHSTTIASTRDEIANAPLILNFEPGLVPGIVISAVCPKMTKQHAKLAHDIPCP